MNRAAFWVAAGLCAAADLGSKSLVFARLADHPDGAAIPILGSVLQFTRHLNLGGVWGMLSGETVVLLAITAVLLPAIVLMAYSCREPGAPLWALGLLLGGAMGNLYDRIWHGAVRDFLWIDLGFWPANPWPVFNIADVGIVLGVGVFMLWNLRQPAVTPAEPGS